jgi:hypothetical protein
MIKYYAKFTYYNSKGGETTSPPQPRTISEIERMLLDIGNDLIELKVTRVSNGRLT